MHKPSLFSLALQTAIIAQCTAPAYGKVFPPTAKTIQSTTTPAANNISAETVKLCDDGVDAADDGSFALAIDKLNKVLEKVPNYVWAAEQLSIAHCRLGGEIESTPAAALSEYHKALFDNPTNSKATARAADMIRKLGKNPRLAADRIAMADKAVADKDYISAVIEYEAALALTEDADIRSKLASATELAGARPSVSKEVDFSKYMTTLQSRIKAGWKPPRINLSVKTPVIFELDRNGLIHDLHLTTSTGLAAEDNAAMMAIIAASPFAPLPAGSPRQVQIAFTFAYNVHGGAAKEAFTAVSPADQKRYLKENEETSLQKEISQLEKSGERPQMLIRAILELATLYENNGQDAEAEKSLVHSLKLQETMEHTGYWAKTVNRLALLYGRSGRNDEAEALFKQSIEACQKNPQLGNFNLWRSYKDYADLLRRTKRNDEAKQFADKEEATLNQPGPSISDYDQIIKLNPDDATNYFLRGDLYFKASDWDHAIQDHSKAIELNPHYILAFTHRANAYHHSKRDDQALKDLEKALELEPGCLPAYRMRGRLYKDQKQWDLAIKDYDLVLKTDKQDFDSLIERGNCYIGLKQYPQAAIDYDAAIKIRPEEALGYSNKGLALLDEKKYDDAIQLLDKAIRLNPSFTAAYTHRGLAYARLKQYQKALPDYERALALNPSDPTTHLNRGHSLLFSKQFEASIQESSEAIKLKPEYALAYSNRSCAQWALGNYQLAITDADKAISLDPKMAEAYCNRAKSRFSLKDYDAALSDLSKAIDLEPNVLEGEAYFYRAKIYQAQGKDALAADDLKKATVLDYHALVGD